MQVEWILSGPETPEVRNNLKMDPDNTLAMLGRNDVKLGSNFCGVPTGRKTPSSPEEPSAISDGQRALHPGTSYYFHDDMKENIKQSL